MQIRPSIIQRLARAQTSDDLVPLVHEAVKVEHATIPPYLCAYFTLKLGANREVANIIRSVVVEEMLHFAIVLNLINALGGQPNILAPDFLPTYPGNLPMGIGDTLSIRLRKCSVEQVRDVFMAIEKPEHPVVAANARALAARAMLADVTGDLGTFDTIGAFYRFLAHKLQEIGQKAFVGRPDRQVVESQWFPDKKEMFPITDVASAKAAIEIIVGQGEGTSTDPFDLQNEPAHYYRFAEVVHGRRIIPQPGQTPDYAFAGDVVPFDPAQVWDMDDDPKLAKYRLGTASRRAADRFAAAYASLLRGLNEAFDGRPDTMDQALGSMYELRLLAQQALQTRAEFDGQAPASVGAPATGLCFELGPDALAST